MPRTEEANQRRREGQRARILDGARKVFARKGMAATMADVAAAAAVSQGLAYRYFASKEEIVAALVEDAVQVSSAGVQLIMDMPGTPGERLNVLISRALEARRERSEPFQLLAQMFRDDTAPDNIRELVGRQGQRYRSVMRQLIVEGQAIGEVAKGDPDQLVAAVMACLDGLSRLAVRDPEGFSTHAPTAEIVLRMLKP